MSDATVYPITAAFEKDVDDVLHSWCVDNRVMEPKQDIRWIMNSMKSTLGEYEHGTADIEDVFRGVIGLDLSDVDDNQERRKMCLEMYSAVLRDIALVLVNT